MEGHDVPILQEFLAQMLGVRRASITDAVGSLERLALIERLGHAYRIVDRQGLEAATCECYALIREWDDKVLRLATDGPS
jgi:hypothetical protein